MHIYGEAKERDLKQLPFSVPKFWHYRDGQTVFSSIAADWGNGYILTGLGDPVQVLGENVTANYFDLLGIRPILGRNFLPKEEMHDDVALITENFWRKRLSSDPGSSAGASPSTASPRRSLASYRSADFVVWPRHRSIHSQAVRKLERDERAHDAWLQLHALHRAVEAGRHHATSAVNDACLGAKLSTQHPETADCTWTSVLVSAPEDVTGDLRPAFVTLLIAVGAVLLIACSNVANLLARSV